jgi:prepilin-type N-terminal cleavage/methylation domain-containing protein
MAGRIYSTSKGFFMSTRFRRHAASGYSLVELLVVLAIVAILAIAGVTMIGNRQSGAVHALLDEVEGALNNAQQATAAAGGDVAIVTWGTWDAGTPLRLAHGDATQTDALIQTAANDLLASLPHTDALGLTVAVPFRFLANDSIQSRARIVTLGSPQWINVMQATPAGTVNQDITTVAPFSTVMAGVLVDGPNSNLCQLELSAAPHRIVISGANKRFTTTFIIPIVGTTTSGGALPGGPMGMIVGLANGSSIYKFYNPGARDSDGLWRRL